MKIAFNPSTVAALIAPPNNKDITFDLRGHNIFARGVKFCGTDTNTWRDIKINNVSIDSNTLDLRDGDNTTLTNTNGVVTINSTWRPVVDNLTSDSTTSSLSANLGRILKALIDGKSDSGHNHDGRYLRLNGSDTMLGNLNLCSIGSSYIGKGSGDKSGADFTEANIVIRSWWGISFKSYDDIVRTYIDTRTGNIGTKGVLNAVGAVILGRIYNGGDDEGILIKKASNGWAGLILGSTDSDRSCFYLGSNSASWKYVKDGIDTWIQHPYKNGTIALTSDIPTSLKNPYALTISLNGTSQGPYDGSAAKNINITPSSIGAATSDHNHDGRYVRYYAVTTLDCNNLAVGLTAAGVSATNAAHTNHSAFLYISDVGTPFQIQIPDSSVPYIYKRYYSSGTWSGWFKLNAGYADSAGNADTVDGVHANQLCRIYTFNVHNSIIKVGTLTSGQYGHVCKLRFNSGIGYNAGNQDKAMTVVIRASNGDANSNGFYFEAHSESYRAGAFTTFYLHQTSKTQCELYMAAFDYSGQSTYEVSFSAGDSWVHEISIQSALPTSNIFTLPNYQIAYTDYNVGSAIKLETARTIWGQSFDGTADVNGTIYINNSNSSNGAIRLNNNINSNARISAISDQVIFNTSSAIRFGETAWDWNQWAGLKYTHSNKTIYLGIANGSVFNSNSTLSGGTLNLRAGISNIDLNSGTSIIGRPTNGSPYSSRVTLYDTSISLSAYGDISMSTGSGAIELSSGYSSIKLSCLGNNASINPEGFKVEASRGVYLNSGNSGNVYLCLGGGNVGIGTTSPIEKLDVNGNIISNNIRIYGNEVTNDSKGLFIQASDKTNRAFLTYNGNVENTSYLNICSTFGNIVFSTSRNVGIGTTAPAYKLDVNGLVRASGFHHSSMNSNNYMLLAGGGYKSFGGNYNNPIFLGYLNLEHGNDGTVSSSFYCLGYSVSFTYTRGGNYCKIYIPNTSYQTFYIRAAIASVNYSGGGMDTWVGTHRGDGAWWLHCYAYSLNEVRVKGFRLANDTNDSWWGGNPLRSSNGGANKITVCIFGYVTFK